MTMALNVNPQPSAPLSRFTQANVGSANQSSPLKGAFDLVRTLGPLQGSLAVPVARPCAGALGGGGGGVLDRVGFGADAVQALMHFGM